MSAVQAALLLAATGLTGLSAGFFYAFAHDVMPGLAATDDATFVDAFRAIDRQVVNPWFLVVYLGALPVTLAAAAVHVGGASAILALTTAALLLYAATFAITGVVHVPMNGRLQAQGATSQITDLPAVRSAFARRWVRWNLVRTVTCVAGFGCLCVALLLHRG